MESSPAVSRRLRHGHRVLRRHTCRRRHCIAKSAIVSGAAKHIPRSTRSFRCHHRVRLNIRHGRRALRFNIRRRPPVLRCNIRRGLPCAAMQPSSAFAAVGDVAANCCVCSGGRKRRTDELGGGRKRRSVDPSNGLGGIDRTATYPTDFLKKSAG